MAPLFVSILESKCIYAFIDFLHELDWTSISSLLAKQWDFSRSQKSEMEINSSNHYLHRVPKTTWVLGCWLPERLYPPGLERHSLLSDWCCRNPRDPLWNCFPPRSWLPFQLDFNFSNFISPCAESFIWQLNLGLSSAGNWWRKVKASKSFAFGTCKRARWKWNRVLQRLRGSNLLSLASHQS